MSSSTTPSTIEDQRAKAGFWFTESEGPGFQCSFRLNSISFTGETKFQKVDIVDTVFGKTLVTDGKTQSCSSDEKVYHESLVVPSMLLSNPKRVYIGGGGELATAREVLRFPSVEACVMVDLDGELVDLCKELMPEWSDGCHEDPRFSLIVGDAEAELRKVPGSFDLIIMDISDPIEAGPGIKLYTKEFYTYARSRLNPGGVFVTQSGCANPNNWDQCFAPVVKTCESVWENVLPYRSNIPSFVGCWGFSMCWGAEAEKGLDTRDAKDVEDRLAVMKPAFKDGKSYEHFDGEAWMGMCCLEKSIRKGLKNETRVITEANPVYMF